MPDPAYIDAVKYEVYTNGTWSIGASAWTGGTWVDVTADVVKTVEASYGIRGNTDIDRVGSAGQLTFTLKNDEGCIGGVNGYYTPYTAGAMAGWDIGIPVRVTITWRGLDRVRFFGYIKDIQPDSGGFGNRSVKVMAVDWMEYAEITTVQYILDVPLYPRQDLRIDEAVPHIIFQIVPGVQNTDYNTGYNVFPYVFDAVDANTRATNEFTKLALSELGYIYIKHDPVYGETLKVEGRYDRIIGSSIHAYPMLANYAGDLLQEDGDNLLTEAGDTLVLDELQEARFDNVMRGMRTSFGTNVVNRVKAKIYPKLLDTTVRVLAEIEEPLQFVSTGGLARLVTLVYKNPVNNEKFASINTEGFTPTTDFLVNTQPDGSGTDVTVSEMFLLYGYNTGTSTIVYYASSTPAGETRYFTKLQLRGDMLNPLSELEFTADGTGYDRYGVRGVILNMPYLASTAQMESFATSIVYANQAPRMVVNEVSFNANYSDDLMQAFIYCDVGDKIQLIENQTGVNSEFFIQSVRWTIDPGGIINYSWALKDATSLSGAYWFLETVGYGELDQTTILGL